MNFLDNLFVLISIDETANGFKALLECNLNHPVYRAHFPGNPITPGACLLKTVGEILGQKLGKPLFLKLSKNIKYINVLVPAEGKVIECDFSHLVETESECKAQVVIADETTVYSKMSLTYSYEPF